MAEKKFDVDINLQNNALLNPVFPGGQPSGLPVKKKFETAMSAGVLVYTLPELPDSNFEVQAEINGINIFFNLVGVNLTVLDFTAGEITTDLTLRVYYFK